MMMKSEVQYQMQEWFQVANKRPWPVVKHYSCMCLHGLRQYTRIPAPLSEWLHTKQEPQLLDIHISLDGQNVTMLLLCLSGCSHEAAQGGGGSLHAEVLVRLVDVAKIGHQ
jgi:hypothetical protein